MRSVIPELSETEFRLLEVVPFPLAPPGIPSRKSGKLVKVVLPRTIPLDLDMEFGGAQATLELGGLSLQSARLEFGAAEATLAFLGIGVQAPRASWGSLIVEGYRTIRVYPHLLFFPAICIAVALVSFTFLGDGLRDALDPKLKGKQ